MTDLTVAAAFDGVGGFDLAFERAGATPKVTIEVDKQARGVLTEHWPDITHLEDITKVTADDIRAAGFVPERGILTAGFPCQDLSVAGRRAGMVEGTRSGLYWHLDRLVAELRPAWIVYENVPGLLSSTCPCRGDGSCEMDNGRSLRCPRNGKLHTVTGGACVGGCIASHGGTMGAVLGSVGNRGYGFAYRVLDAQRFGVPQRRRRVFIVGRLGDDGRAPAQVLLDAESSIGDLAARPETWSRPTSRPVRSARGFGVSRGEDHIAGTLLSNNDGGLRTTDISGAYVVDEEAVRTFNVTPESGQGKDLRVTETEVSGALTASQLADQGDRGVRILTYRKAGRAQSNQDDETWVEDDAANTVNTFDVGDTRATELVVTKAEGLAFNQRDEARTAHEQAYAIQGQPGVDEQLVHVTSQAYAVHGEHSTAMTGGGDAAVAREVDQARSLDTNGGYATNQGGNVVVTPVAMRGRGGENMMEAGEPGDPAHALRSADGGSSAPMVAVTPITTKNATRTGDDTAGTGIGAEGDHAPAVQTTAPTAVAIEVSPAVTAKWSKGTGGPSGDEVQNLAPVRAGVVRRLTPLECERLQGYPDDWTKVSNGKEQADSPRYKQMGNSLAVPCVEWIAHRLVAVDRMMKP